MLLGNLFVSFSWGRSPLRTPSSSCGRQRGMHKENCWTALPCSTWNNSWMCRGGKKSFVLPMFILFVVFIISIKFLHLPYEIRKCYKFDMFYSFITAFLCVHEWGVWGGGGAKNVLRALFSYSEGSYFFICNAIRTAVHSSMPYRGETFSLPEHRAATPFSFMSTAAQKSIFSSPLMITLVFHTDMYSI